jgi:hypothetical protein
MEYKSNSISDLRPEELGVTPTGETLAFAGYIRQSDRVG